MILNNQLSRHGLKNSISNHIEAYITESKDEMETLELSKVYMSCIKNKVELSDGFRREMDDLMLN